MVAVVQIVDKKTKKVIGAVGYVVDVSELLRYYYQYDTDMGRWLHTKSH